MSTTITDNAVGKTVVNARGAEVGIVTAVNHGTAYVDPDPDLTDELKAALGWEDADEETYPLQEVAIGTVTEDDIRLREDL